MKTQFDFIQFRSIGFENQVNETINLNKTISEDSGWVLLKSFARLHDKEHDFIELDYFEQPKNGQLKYDDKMDLYYKPNDNFYGLDEFEFTTRDENGLTYEGTAKINVEAINDAPYLTLAPISIATNAGPTNIEILSQAYDIEGDLMSFIC